MQKKDPDDLFAAKAAAVPAAPTGAGVVLLVEDEEGLRQLIGTVLGQLNYTVLSAKDPQEALELEAGRGGSIDLLLTDLTLPVMSGQELARVLSPRRPTMKILFMTGSEPPERVDGLRMDSYHCLLKPFRPSALVKEVQALLKPA
jgi:DNA-binding response OmpR family regulator